MADGRKFTRSVGRNAAKSWDTGSRGVQSSVDPFWDNPMNKRPIFSSVLKRKRESPCVSRATFVANASTHLENVAANRMHTRSLLIAGPHDMTKEDVDEVIDNGGKRAKRIGWADLKNTNTPDTTKLPVTTSAYTSRENALHYLPSWNKRIEPKFASSEAPFEDDDYGRARTKYRDLFDLSSYTDSDRVFDHIDPKMQTLIELAVERSFAVPVLKLINQALSHEETNAQWSDSNQPQRGSFPTASRTTYPHAGPSPAQHRSNSGGGSGIDRSDPLFNKTHATHPITWDTTTDTPSDKRLWNYSSSSQPAAATEWKYPDLRPLVNRARARGGDGEVGSERARQALAAAFKPREDDTHSEDDEGFGLLDDERLPGA